MAAGVRSVIYVDSESIGALKPNMFAHALLEPGKHGVLVRNDGLASGSGGLITFEAKAGEIAYLWVGVTGHGWGTLTIDHFDTPADARECIEGATYSMGPAGASPTPLRMPPSFPAPTAMPAAQPVEVKEREVVGQESTQVERLAEVRACNAQPKAIFTAKGPGFEAYRVACTSGDTLLVRCEFGNCRVLK